MSKLYYLLFQIRPDRQTLYWSATWPKEVEQLARTFLFDPYKVYTIHAIINFIIAISAVCQLSWT
jgi:superfamily II DNA/RNA helicase